MTDWSQFRQCPVCFAELAAPCMRMTGITADGPVSIEAANAHGGRELRAASTRKGES